MKTTKQFSIMMAIVLLSFSINSCDKLSNNDPNQESGIIITLYVDTGSINQENIDATCNFGQTNGESNKDYTTVVEFGDKITWVGESSSGNDKVKIKKIKYVKDAHVLTTNEKRNSWFSSKVRGKVNKKADFDTIDGYIEKYLIEFKIKGNNEKFIIDPKLQVLH